MHISGLVDCHLHLQDFDAGTDVDLLIEQAESAGVTHFVCNGDAEHDWQKVLDLALAYPNVIPCFGLHPWMLEDRSPDWLGTLEQFLRRVPSGVGETGLDHLHRPVHEAQEEALRVHLDLARRLDRPVMIHCVRAYGLLMDVLRDEAPLPAGFMIHAYGGAPDIVDELADMGAYFSFAGNVLNPAYERGRKSIVAVPRDRLLIETDAPALLPPEALRPYSVPASDSTYNHPANLPTIVRGAAEIIGEDAESLRATLWKNARRFLAPIREVDL
jgi:TatD DNase family protein